MSRKDLAHYLEFNTSWSEMESWPEDHVAAVSVLSYAVSETNALMKLYLCQEHNQTGQRALDSGINIHKFLLLRTWSARLFEAMEFFKSGCRKDFLSDANLMALAEEALADFKGISSGEGYEVARDIRNESANHYSFKAARKNLKHVSRSMDCNMYLAKKGGNEFFPLGEAVMFHARLNRRWANVADKKERDDRFRAWLLWNLQANKWLQKVHAQFLNSLVFDALGRSGVRRKAYWVPDGYAGQYTQNLTPIYFQDVD